MSILQSDRAVLAGILAGIVWSVPAAQAPNARTACPTAAECVARHIGARGGAVRLGAVKSITRVSRLGTFAFTATWQAPDRYRLEQTDQDSGAYDLQTAVGEQGWSGGRGGARLAADEIQRLRESVAWGWELLHLDALGAKVELVADAPPSLGQIGLGIRFGDGQSLTIWLDPKTFLEASRSRVLHAPDGTATSSFSETRGATTSSGILFPTAIGPAEVTFTVDGVIPPNWFAIKIAPWLMAIRQ